MNAGMGVWFGVGVRSRRPLQLSGRSPIDAFLVSYDDHARTAEVRVEGWRLDQGPGLALDAVLLIVTSAPNPMALHGHLIGWIDVEASLGQRWPVVARVVSRLEAGARRARLARRVNGGTSEDRGGRSMIRAGDWKKLRGLVLNAAEAIGMENDAPLTQVRAIAIPGAGLGLDTSLAVGVGRVIVQARAPGDAAAAVAS